MQGKTFYQDPLFVTLDLNKFIPKNHKLRRLDKVLNLDFLGELTAPHYAKGKGRASIDPEVYFRMMIVKVLYGINSDRRLCEEIQLNIAYRWFCKLRMEDKVPDHSSLGKIRDRLGEETFAIAFDQVLEQCRAAGLLKGRQMITDGTIVESDASKNSVIRTKKGSKVKATNTTDPDASLTGRSKYGGKPCYKGHWTIDGDSRVITDCYMTSGNVHDVKPFLGRVDHQIRKYDLKPREWLADKGYGFGPTFEFFRSRKILTYIPIRKKIGTGKHTSPENFIYDKKTNTYNCPQGETLFPHKPSGGTTRYVINNGACKTCPIKDDCLKDNYNKAHRRIHRSIFQEEFDRVKWRSKTPYYRNKLAERAYKVEGIFGEAKTFHGLRKAYYRGRSKMQIQAYLIAMTMNLKRLSAAKIRLFLSRIWPESVQLERIFSLLILKETRMGAIGNY